MEELIGLIDGNGLTALTNFLKYISLLGKYSKLIIIAFLLFNVLLKGVIVTKNDNSRGITAFIPIYNTYLLCKNLANNIVGYVMVIFQVFTLIYIPIFNILGIKMFDKIYYSVLKAIDGKIAFIAIALYLIANAVLILMGIASKSDDEEEFDIHSIINETNNTPQVDPTNVVTPPVNNNVGINTYINNNVAQTINTPPENNTIVSNINNQN